MTNLKFTNDAKERFNNLVKMIPHNDNVLHYYDNVTYNARFYLLPLVVQQSLSYNKVHKLVEDFKLDDKDKIIIAETGVSSKINIDSILLKTIYTSMTDSEMATTFSVEMKLTEINSCQMLNHISVISYLLGYESYIEQPYHLDIWFSGYRNDTHEAVQIIPEVGVLSYEFILGKVTTSVSNSGVVYNCTGTSTTGGSVSKELLSIPELGKITFDGAKDIESFKNELEKNINEEYFKKNPHYEKYYPDKKLISIRLIDSEDMNADNSDLQEGYVSQSLKGITMIEEMTKENDDDKKDTNSIKATEEYSLTNVFQQFALKTEKLKHYIVRPAFKLQTLANGDDMQHIKYYMDVIFVPNEKLKQDQIRFEEASKGVNHSKEELRDNSYATASEYLQELLFKELIPKRYEWLFSGDNIDVIELNSTIDKLWYSNIPIWDIAESSKNSVSAWVSEEQRIKAQELIKQMSEYNTNINKDGNSDSDNKRLTQELKDVMNKSIRTTMDNYEPMRHMANDSKLYIEDVYYCLDRKFIDEILESKVLLEKVDPYSPNQQQSEVDGSDPTIIAQTAYRNFFSQNMVSLKFKILGDPFWLNLFTDKTLYKSSYKDIGNMYHFVFKLRSPMDMKPDGTYDYENVVDFTNIFQLVQTSSLFENGKFIQNMEAIISPTFLPLGRLKI